MKTGYITDQFSTLAGLAAVAYGSVDSFREVQNQIINNSPTKIFDSQRPSDIFQSFLGSQDYFVGFISDKLAEYYSLDENFSDYIDEALGANWIQKVNRILPRELFLNMDSSSSYGNKFKDYLSSSFRMLFPEFDEVQNLTEEIINKIESDPVFGKDINFLSTIVNSNPRTKLDTPAANSVIYLENNIDLDKDHRGISFVSGYLTPQEYYSEIAYPGFDAISTFPTTFKDSILDGYVGYPTGVSTETAFNPAGAESIKDSASNPAAVLNDSDIWNSVSILGQLDNIPGLDKTDKEIYEISLIGPRVNNLLTFDPATMSNGDYFDTTSLPKILNADKEDGVSMSSRDFSNTF